LPLRPTAVPDIANETATPGRIGRAPQVLASQISPSLALGRQRTYELASAG
jgi:hypothetical protein